MLSGASLQLQPAVCIHGTLWDPTRGEWCVPRSSCCISVWVLNHEVFSGLRLSLTYYVMLLTMYPMVSSCKYCESIDLFAYIFPRWEIFFGSLSLFFFFWCELSQGHLKSMCFSVSFLFLFFFFKISMKHQ